MVAIILLNWNGWEDTIECVNSIYKVENTEFVTLVIDNGSSNDSVSRIIDCAKKLNVRTLDVKEGDVLQTGIKNKDFILYQLMNNYGFAKGNNKGLQLLTNQDISYFWILNNDTVIEPDSLNVLERFLINKPQYCGCTPQIRYFSDKNKIWNCGGKLIWGFRRYYYADKCNVVFNKDFFDISFVTGCALLVRRDALKSDGTLFTEKFFFGEEDFDLSMRFRNQKKIMACCTNSIIYHKVNASINKKPKLEGIYIHYLNRYVNIRLHFTKLSFFFWRVINNIYLFVSLKKHAYSFPVIMNFIYRLNNDCFLYDGVSKDMFDAIILKRLKS